MRKPFGNHNENDDMRKCFHDYFFCEFFELSWEWVRNGKFSPSTNLSQEMNQWIMNHVLVWRQSIAVLKITTYQIISRRQITTSNDKITRQRLQKFHSPGQEIVPREKCCLRRSFANDVIEGYLRCAKAYFPIKINHKTTLWRSMRAFCIGIQIACIIEWNGMKKLHRLKILKLPLS